MQLVDRYMPAYQFHERHARRMAARPEEILACVAAFRAEDDRFFRIAIRIRELPARLLRLRNIPAKPFGLREFTRLGQSGDEIVYGLVGRFWRPDYGLVPIADGAVFVAFAGKGVAKLTLAFRTQPEPDGRTLLVTETRVWCPDLSTRLRFLPYWILIRPVSGLIRRRMLASIARTSERPARS